MLENKVKKFYQIYNKRVTSIKVMNGNYIFLIHVQKLLKYLINFSILKQRLSLLSQRFGLKGNYYSLCTLRGTKVILWNGIKANIRVT